MNNWFSVVLGLCLSRYCSGMLDADGNVLIIPWMEVGFIHVPNTVYLQVQSRLSTFRKPHVLIGPPNHGNANLYSGYSSCFRLKDVTNTTVDPGFVAFTVTMIQPNDSWCNYTWWTPVVEPSQKVAYMIIEEGHYYLSGAEFDIHASWIHGHCKQDSYRHFFYKEFSDVTVKPRTIAQAQTMNDPRYLAFRERDDLTNNRGVTIFLQLHNADTKWHPRAGDCQYYHYEDHYDNNRWRQAYTITYERISIFAYVPHYVATCTEGIAFETHEVDGITSDPRYFPYYWYYTSEPAVFGMVNSYNGGDQVAVRSFNHSLIGCSVFSQEDECQKPGMIHQQGEIMGFFVAGAVDFSKSRTNPYTDLIHVDGSCNIDIQSSFASPTLYPIFQPSDTPTAEPTEAPSTTLPPSPFPTAQPTEQLTEQPTMYPTPKASQAPTQALLCLMYVLYHYVQYFVLYVHIVLVFSHS